MCGLLLLLTGCHHRGDQYVPARYTTISGTARAYGPVPTFGTYDGFTQLSGSVELALMQGGQAYEFNVVNSTSYQEGYAPDPNFRFEESEYWIPSGMFNLSLVTATGLPGTVERGPEGVSTYAVLDPGQAINVQYGQDVTGLTVDYYTTGAAPYATLSGTLLVNGNPPQGDDAQIVLTPDKPLVGGAKSYVWSAQDKAALYARGEIPYTVPYLSYGTYDVSYAGSGIRSSADYLKVDSASVTIDSASEVGPDFTVTATDPQRPYGVGTFSGAVTGPSGALTVRAERTDATEDPDPNSRRRYAFWHLPVDSHGPRTYTLGWLEPGRYNITLMQLDGHALLVHAGVMLGAGEDKTDDLEVAP